jgi:hypothetical protein
MSRFDFAKFNPFNLFNNPLISTNLNKNNADEIIVEGVGDNIIQENHQGNFNDIVPNQPEDLNLGNQPPVINAGMPLEERQEKDRFMYWIDRGVNYLRPLVYYVEATVKKNCNNAELELLDPASDIAQALDKIETVHNFRARELSDWLANFLGSTVCKIIENDGVMLATLTNIIGRERIDDTVKVNLLNLIANGLEGIVIDNNNEGAAVDNNSDEEDADFFDVLGTAFFNDEIEENKEEKSDDELNLPLENNQIQGKLAEESQTLQEHVEEVDPSESVNLNNPLEEIVPEEKKEKSDDELNLPLENNQIQGKLAEESQSLQEHIEEVDPSESVNLNNPLEEIAPEEKKEESEEELILIKNNADEVNAAQQGHKKEVSLGEPVNLNESLEKIIPEEEKVTLNLFFKLVDVLKNCFLIDYDEIEGISLLQRKAERECKAFQAQLDAFAVYGHTDPTHKKQIRRQALKAYSVILKDPALALSKEEKDAQLKELRDKLFCTDKNKRDLYIILAEADLMFATEEVKKQIKCRQDLFKEKITPRILSVFFPNGAASIKLYYPYLAVYPAQELVWDLIQSKAPEYLLELFPFIFQVNRPQQEALINDNPHAETIWRGINLLSEEIVKLAMDKLEVPSSVRATIDEFIQPYVQYLLIHVFNTLTKLERAHFVDLLEIIGEMKSNMSKGQDPTSSLCNGLTKAWELLTVQEKNQLFGLPPFITKIINEKLIAFGSKNMNRYVIYPIHQLNAQKVVNLPKDSIAGTSVKVTSVRNAIKSNLEVQIPKQISNAVIMDNGFSKLVNQISKGLGESLAEKEKVSPFISFLGSLIESGQFNSIFRDAIDLVHTQEAYPLQLHLIKLLTPVLTNFSVKGISRLLEMEKQGGKELDRSLLMAVLPTLTDYVKTIHRENGLVDNKLRGINCYKDKVPKLLSVFLPKGVDDLKELFPQLSKEELQMVLDLTANIPNMMSSAKDSIFTVEIIRDACISGYESAIKSFNDTASAPTLPPSADVVLSPEEKAWQDRLDRELEELLMAVARMTDLPIDRLLKMTRFVPGKQSIKKAIIKSISFEILKKMNGKFIEEQLKNALDAQQVKMSTVHPDSYYNEKINRLERELIVEGMAYGLKKTSESIHNTLQVVKLPVIKQVKDAVEALCSFIIVRVIGGMIRLAGMDTWLIDKLYSFLQRNRVRFQTEFAKPAKHEGVVVDIIEEVERVLIKNWNSEAPSTFEAPEAPVVLEDPAHMAPKDLADPLEPVVPNLPGVDAWFNSKLNAFFK